MPGERPPSRSPAGGQKPPGPTPRAPAGRPPLGDTPASAPHEPNEETEPTDPGRPPGSTEPVGSTAVPPETGGAVLADPEGSRGRRRGPRRGRRLVTVGLWALLAVAVLLVVGYAGLALKAGDTVPADASVAGVDIGGMHTAAAERKLRHVLGSRAARPIRVAAADKKASYSAASAGLSLDVPDSVLNVGGGHSYWPGRLWRYYTGGHDHDAVTHQQRSRFLAVSKRVVTLVSEPDVEGRVTFERGRAISHAARNGRRISLEQAGEALTHGFLRSTVSRPDYDVVEPDIDNDAVSSAMRDFARPATSGPVTLELKGQKLLTSPDQFTPAVTMVPDGDQLTAQLDVAELLAAIEPAMDRLDGTPRPARIEIQAGRPVVVPSAPGTTFDRGDLRDKFLDLLTKKKAGDRTASVDTVQGPPSFDTAAARSMKVSARVASTTTRFGYADYRNTNIARAADLLDGTIVRPGRTFSLARTIGRPDRANGFTPGLEITGGVFKADAGAGLSQVASTLFSSTFEAGLKDAGHEVTSVYTGRYPLGREASFEYGKDDLRFTDNTKYGVLITAAASASSQSGDGSLRIELWSTKAWDVTLRTGKRHDRRPPRVVHKTGAACGAAIGYPGFSVDVTRVFRKPGRKSVDHRQTTTTVYLPSNSVVCDP